MKKIILVSLIVIAFSNPLLAQIELEGIFGIGGTLWYATFEGQIDWTGFAGGKVFGIDGATGICLLFPDSSYADFIFLSTFQLELPGHPPISGLLSPLLGIGIIVLPTGSAIMLKALDNWYPFNCIDIMP
jgi:hypothetical protein